MAFVMAKTSNYPLFCSILKLHRSPNMIDYGDTCIKGECPGCKKVTSLNAEGEWE